MDLIRFGTSEAPWMVCSGKLPVPFVATTAECGGRSADTRDKRAETGHSPSTPNVIPVEAVTSLCTRSTEISYYINNPLFFSFSHPPLSLSIDRLSVSNHFFSLIFRMAGDENEGERGSRGADWEVVSLTASTYAAAPGPKEFLSTDDDNGFSRTEVEPSRAMFLSRHFVFLPSEHENLPMEPDTCEIHDEQRVESADYAKECGLGFEEHSSHKSEEENLNIKSFSEVDDQHVVQFADDKGKGLSLSSMKFEEGKDLQGLDLLEEHGLYEAATYSSFHTKSDIQGTIAFDDGTTFSNDNDVSMVNLDASMDSFMLPDDTKEDKTNLPCEAWWKRQVASLYCHAKEANTFWSVVVAAALMGLVILGQQWQHERWQLGFNSENMNRMLSPIFRFKDVLVGGHHQSPAIQGNASARR